MKSRLFFSNLTQDAWKEISKSLTLNEQLALSAVNLEKGNETNNFFPRKDLIEAAERKIDEKNNLPLYILNHSKISVSENARVRIILFGCPEIQSTIRKMCKQSKDNSMVLFSLHFDVDVMTKNDYTLVVTDTQGRQFRDFLKRQIVGHPIIIVCASDQESLTQNINSLNNLTQDKNDPSLNEKLIFIAAPEKISLTDNNLPVITVDKESCFHTLFFDALKAESERLIPINRAKRKAEFEKSWQEKTELKQENQQKCSMM